MKQLILSFTLLFLLSCVQSNTRTTIKEENNSDIEVFKSNFIPVVDSFIDSLENGRSDVNIIVIYCHFIFNEECILLTTADGYNPEFMIGYTLYRDFLILYSGVEDTIAKKILNMEFLHKETPDKKYMDLRDIEHDIIFDPIAKFFTIDNTSNIELYEPSCAFKKELYRLEIEHGISPAPPPEP